MKRDELYLRHILDSIERIESYARIGKEEFIKTSHWHDAAIRNFEVIGEAAKRLRDEFKQGIPQYPGKISPGSVMYLSMTTWVSISKLSG